MRHNGEAFWPHFTATVIQQIWVEHHWDRSSRKWLVNAQEMISWRELKINTKITAAGWTQCGNVQPTGSRQKSLQSSHTRGHLDFLAKTTAASKMRHFYFQMLSLYFCGLWHCRTSAGSFKCSTPWFHHICLKTIHVCKRMGVVHVVSGGRETLPALYLM